MSEQFTPAPEADKPKDRIDGTETEPADTPNTTVETQPDTPDTTTETKPESPKAPEARENLLRTHALRQNIVEATATGISNVNSIIHGTQDIKSAITSFRLEASQSRAQRRYERHAHKAENSLFAFRRRKFAAKRDVSKQELDRRTNLVTANETFIQTRQEARDTSSRELKERVANSREFLVKRSKIALERRQRRHDFWESHLSLVESRQEELKKKRQKQGSMLQFRQALFANVQTA